MSMAHWQTRLQGVTDLTVLAPIKQGLINGAPESITYVERMRRLLKVLNGGRIASRESARQPSPFSDLVGRLNRIHSFRFTILPEAGARADAHRMLLTVTFDGGVEAYLRIIWRDLGSLLDAICCHCEGYPIAHRTNYRRYIRWVREHTVAADFFYVDSGASVADGRYREHLESLMLGRHDPQALEYLAATFSLPSAEQTIEASTAAAARSPEAALQAGMRTVMALHAQRRNFPDAPDGDADVLLRFAQDLHQEFQQFVRQEPTSSELHRAYAKALEWFTRTPPRWTRPSERLPTDIDTLRTRVQGGVLDPYERVTHGCLVLLRIPQGGAARVRSALQKWPVTDGRARTHADVHRNIAFTVSGLKALGASPTQLESLPPEFIEGMEARAGLLGDVRANHPDHWRRPTRNWPPGAGDGEPIELSTVHAVVQLRTRSDAEEDLPNALRSEIERLQREGMKILSVQLMRRYAREDRIVGHFGFVDGLSQPTIDSASTSRDRVPVGDVLLGFGNSLGDGPNPEAADELLDHGAFLVVRKLRQRVDVLNATLADAARKLTDDPARVPSIVRELKERMMGRRLDGEALIESPRADNEFTYEGDPSGALCPFESHARRVNPRDANPAPRILRRGMSYGPPVDGPDDERAERGVVFMAYNASIAEQFEVLQRWISGGAAGGFTAGQSDPFCGVPSSGGSRTFRCLYGDRVVKVDLGEQRFVELEWGLYLFAPSLHALRNLDSVLTAQSASPPSPRAPREPPRDFQYWREKLEDKDQRDSAWSEVRAQPHGVLDTQYGVLVGGESAIREVLGDDGRRFSVKGYGERLARSIGDGFLGQDLDAQDRHSSAVNDAIARFGAAQAFKIAREQAEAVLAGILRRGVQHPDGKRHVEFLIGDYVDAALAAICKALFGLPDEENVRSGGAADEARPASCPGHSYAVAQYVFWPHPSSAIVALGEAQGRALLDAASVAFRDGRTSAPLTDAIAAAVREHGGDAQDVARTVVGVMQGLSPTLSGNLQTALVVWNQTRLLWELQDELLHAEEAISFARSLSVIGPFLRASMRARPLPAMIWRTARQRCRLGELEIDAGAKVVVGLMSAVHAGAADDVLFGGSRGGDQVAVHGCPGREMATGLMFGIICALLEAGTLRPTASPVSLLLRSSNRLPA